MKKILSIITLVAVLIVFSVSSFANGYGYQQPQTNPNGVYGRKGGQNWNNQPMNMQMQQRGRRNNKRMNGERMNFGNKDAQIKNQEFIELLAEKYTPDTSNEWKTIFIDREKLIDTIRSDEKIQELREKVMYSQDQRKIQYFRSKFDNGNIEKMREYQNDLITAIKYDDSDMIKNILNKMLVLEKDMNTNIKNAYDEILKSIK
ncbi:hypothetical protein OSSY52_09930 [Tepiditoga spiralis]|uniref:LTXXQ motif family protein n=1 Tax=Tepiditoga spiralis TaxID=2108365 RepID=A0A7G1G9T2_9BACT|nr:hypothetical protein [Tepiditoga spiralis]BBE30852.1 hypothetical protein OSSY52_09930 [Tepiditoga spiralis]